MRKLTFAVAATLFSVVAFGRIVNMDKVGIVMDVPDRFVVKDGGTILAQQIAYLYMDRSTGANINVIKQPKTLSLEAFKNVSVEQYKKLNAKVNKMEVNKEKNTIDIEVEMNMLMLGVKQTTFQKVLVVNNSFVIVSCTAFKPEDSAVMRKVVATVRRK